MINMGLMMDKRNSELRICTPEITSAHMLHVEGILEVTYKDDDGAAAMSRFATVLHTSLIGQISVVSVSLMS